MMSRRRRTYTSSQKYKQQTLLGLLSSSPPSSPSTSFRQNLTPDPPNRKRTRKISSSSASHSDDTKDPDSDVGAIRFEPEVVEASDENHSPRRPKKRKSLRGAHTVTMPTASDESLEETLVIPHNRKKKKVVLASDDDIRPRKRKLIKGMRPLTPEEGDDDILDAEHQVLDNRLRSRGKMTAFQKNLEKLKMLKSRKRGEIVLESSSSETEQSEGSAKTPFKGAKPHRSGESNTSNDEIDSDGEDEQDFIVDDDPHGAPLAQLPLAFSMTTHQDLTHHFKIVCQLFVHMAVRPLADRRPFFERALKEEEYLSVPLQVTRRKLSGMRDSLVASSVWRSSFKKDLETYPKLSLRRLDFAVPGCDACHLGSRSSTLLCRLRGDRYDEYDFEAVSDDESNETSREDEDSDSDRGKDVKKGFHLGRFCATRTKVYHQFSHWERSLYKALQWEIMEAQDDSHRFVKVAYFGGVRPPRDLHDADKVMEWLDQRGIIGREWQKVRNMMDSARGLERGEMEDAGI